jgi:hypothetical protein
MNSPLALEHDMSIEVERNSNGRLSLVKEKRRSRRMNPKILSLGLVIAIAAIALSGIQASVAEGDKVQNTHGEDEGYYDVNNENPYDDTDFPGLDTQNRTGVV